MVYTDIAIGLVLPYAGGEPGGTPHFTPMDGGVAAGCSRAFDEVTRFVQFRRWALEIEREMCEGEAFRRSVYQWNVRPTLPCGEALIRDPPPLAARRPNSP